jgi:hypothetical protein
MLSSFAQSILECVLECFLGIIFFFLGRIVVPVISLRQWKCDGFTANVPRKRLRAAGLYHRRGNQVYLTVEATQLVGFVTFLLGAAGGALVWFWSR